MATTASLTFSVYEWRERREADPWRLSTGAPSWKERHDLCLRPRGARGACDDGHRTPGTWPCNDPFDDRCLPSTLYRLKRGIDPLNRCPGCGQLSAALGDSLSLWAFSRSLARSALLTSNGKCLIKAGQQLKNAVERWTSSQKAFHKADRITISADKITLTRYVLADGDASVGRRMRVDLVKRGARYSVVTEYLTIVGGAWMVDPLTGREAEILVSTLGGRHRVGGLQGFCKILEGLGSGAKCSVCGLPWHYKGWMTGEYRTVGMPLPGGGTYDSWEPVS